jgi:sugar/nucleoside kinase (ribokinase family)
MLGYIKAEGVDGVERHFYIRQLWDEKGSANIEVMDPTVMTFYAEACGGELARAHARAGDPVAIASYLGTNDVFDRSLALFAESYADQNERDFDTLTKAVKDGTIKAETGV